MEEIKTSCKGCFWESLCIEFEACDGSGCKSYTKVDHTEPEILEK